MGFSQEDATEDVCTQVLQLVGIGSPSDAAGDYIVKGNNILAFEPNFIKLDDAHLADFLLCTQVLQLVGIGSPSDAAGDYIVKGNNILAFEPNFIKLDDAHLADFLLQLAVLMDGKASTDYLYMLKAVDGSGQFADSLASKPLMAPVSSQTLSQNAL